MDNYQRPTRNGFHRMNLMKIAANPSRRRVTLFTLGAVTALVILCLPEMQDRQSTALDRYKARPPELTALNIIENTFYVHHPVMAAVSREMVSFEKDYLTEINALKIPIHYDCDNLGGGKMWGAFAYFREVPSRWYACWLHYASLKSGVPGWVPPLPLIDEEYFEQVSVYDSVLRAKQKYTIVEMGARWGTWGARAIAFLRKVNPMPYDILFVESMEVHCEGLREVMRKNNIYYDLVCDYARGPEFVAWAQNQPHINVLDLDIQGAEKEVLANEEVLQVLEDKVHRLIIGTHSEDIHTQMRSKFSHWVKVHDMPRSNTAECVKKYFRTPPQSDRSNFEEVVKRQCYFQSSYGKIAQIDGELILDNPKFYEGETVFMEKDNSVKTST